MRLFPDLRVLVRNVYLSSESRDVIFKYCTLMEVFKMSAARGPCVPSAGQRYSLSPESPGAPANVLGARDRLDQAADRRTLFRKALRMVYGPSNQGLISSAAGTSQAFQE